MPRKAKTSPVVDTPAKNIEQGKYWLPNEARWGGFINARLTDEQKAEFYEWWQTNPKYPTEILEDCLAEGIKFGASYDRENQCSIVTFTGALVDGSNERYCCTSRASTLPEAVALAGWKHVVLAGGDYGNYRPTTSTLMAWG